MKNVLKACLLALILLIGTNANAQSASASSFSSNGEEGGLSFGIKAGINLSSLGGDLENQKAKVGFNAGVTLDKALTQDLYLLTGLEYSIKGTKFEGEKLSLSLGYLQLPIHIGYKLAINDATKVVFRGGPYLAYATNGSWKAEGASVDAFSDLAKEELEIVLKRFDFGLGLGIGAEFGQIGVTLGYDLGLSNIHDSTEANSSVKTQNAYLSVGYRF